MGEENTQPTGILNAGTYDSMPDLTPDQQQLAKDNDYFNNFQFDHSSDRPSAENPGFWGSFEKLFQSDRGAQMMLSGIAMGAKGILDWQSQRMAEQSKLEQIDRMGQVQYSNQQNAIDADIKRRSSRAKLRNSTAGVQPVLGIRG